MAGEGLPYLEYGAELVEMGLVSVGDANVGDVGAGDVVAPDALLLVVGPQPVDLRLPNDAPFPLSEEVREEG